MIFYRRIPTRRYSDYRLYRSILREVYRYRCAYCLRHEYFLGGEAGCCIDHHRPTGGLHARPELQNDYSNLYWCCWECNENKANTWPDPEDYIQGSRFIDPCETEDDHDKHLHVHADGTIIPLTNAGRYTCQILKLWRRHLVFYRAELYRRHVEVEEISSLLSEKKLRPELREPLEAHLRTLLIMLEPPVFDRPR